MIGGLVNMLYNFVDGIWVSGLGASRLAAVGLFFPFMIIISALANGIGMGGSSAIARAIGKRNKKLANNLAEHTLIIGIIFGIIVGYSIYPFLKDIFLLMGATEKVSNLTTLYGEIILLASPLIFISSMGIAILRGEGDTKRAMYIMVAGAIVNIILDPIFIYILNLGIMGAAIATVLSITITASAVIFWLLYKKNTYVQLKLKYFKFKSRMIKEIFKVGIPSSITQMSASFSMIILNAIILTVGGTNGMATFSAGWRVIMLGIVPIRGISLAGVSVFGTAFGEKNLKKLKEGYKYAIKYSTLIGLFICITIFVFAPQLAYLFTYSKNSQYLSRGIITLLRFLSIYFIAFPFGMMTASFFRGIGWGMHSLVITLTRSLFLQPIIAYILAIVIGINGIWIGIDIAVIILGLFSILWIREIMNKKLNLLFQKT